MAILDLSPYRTPSSLPYLRILAYIITIAMHSTNIGVMLQSFREDVMEDPNIQKFYLNQDKFITCWTFMAQSIHAFIGISCDILTLKGEDQKEQRLLKYLKWSRDLLFATIVVPFTLFIPTLFWPLFLYNRELILPTFTTKIVNSLSNHIMHTFVAPLTLWELAFQPRRKPEHHGLNLTILGGYTLFYLTIIFRKFFREGFFPYPLMTILYGTIWFPIFMLFVFSLLTIYYYLQWSITSFLWGAENQKIDNKIE